MLELFYHDTETLKKSFSKYKNKNGRKAQNLLSMIQSAEAFNALVDNFRNEEISKRNDSGAG
ncbi:MAG TPA: hypothetical protein VLA13_03975 [Massilibacterium sp.]|nr:hypothetical protein [Massilibacterium sp.]